MIFDGEPLRGWVAFDLYRSDFFLGFEVRFFNPIEPWVEEAIGKYARNMESSGTSEGFMSKVRCVETSDIAAMGCVDLVYVIKRRDLLNAPINLPTFLFVYASPIASGMLNEKSLDVNLKLWISKNAADIFGGCGYIEERAYTPAVEKFKRSNDPSLERPFLNALRISNERAFLKRYVSHENGKIDLSKLNK